jgi:hypothetical protein
VTASADDAIVMVRVGRGATKASAESDRAAETARKESFMFDLYM